MGVHGGTDETSLMLHLAPDLVDMSRAARNVPEQLASQPVRALRRARSASGGCRTTSARTATSATRPTATAERGAELFEARRRPRSPRRSREIAAFDFGR